MLLNHPKNWVPSRFLVRNDCALIELVNFEGRKLTESFMRFDLSHCRQRQLVDYTKVLGYCSESRDLSQSVAGIIFHMSRCGSTLSTQMLRHSSKHVIISEADLFGQFLQNFRGSPQQLVASLRDLIALMADSLCDPEQKLVIKWSSWNIFVIEAICQALPGVPMCYQYRAPAEVLVSLLKTTAEWMDLDVILKSQRQHRYFSSSKFENPYIELLHLSGGQGVSEAEMAARFIGKCCERALKHSKELLMVPYTSLPQAVLSQIAPYFSIDMTGVEKSRARIESRMDTKAIGKTAAFTSDSKDKQEQVSTEIETLCDQHIMPALSELIARAPKV